MLVGRFEIILLQMKQQNAKEKKRMIVICPHPENMAPGQRLKYEQYFDYFREHNIEVTVSHL